MNRSRCDGLSGRTGTALGLGTLVVLLALAGGCQQPAGEMSMAPPPRPVELDKLDMFVGTWDDEWTMQTPGTDQVMSGKGVVETVWSANKYALTGQYRSVPPAEGEGIVYASSDIWTWDPKAGVYRVLSFNNFSERGDGTLRHDPATGEWLQQFKSIDMKTGKRTTAEGVSRFVDEDTMVWTFTQWDAWHMNKVMEMSGVSRRRAE